jgi:hypothetical protein
MHIRTIENYINDYSRIVIPAQAGIQLYARWHWIPACAGMTEAPPHAVISFVIPNGSTTSCL